MAKNHFNRRKFLNPYRIKMQAIRLEENKFWSKIMKWKSEDLSTSEWNPLQDK